MRVNLTIFKKGVILVSVPLVFQLAFLGLIALMQSQNAEADRWSLHSKDVLTQSEIVLTRLLNAETGSRGFLLTGVPAFTEPHDAATRDVPAALEQLRTLVKDNPEQEAKAERIASQATQLMAWHAENHRLVQDGNREAAAGLARTLQGKNKMDDIRREINAFVADEQRLAIEREEAVRRSQRRLQWLLVGGTVVSLLCTVLLGFVFGRGIGRRLAKLTDNAERLAQGMSLGPALTGSDEISRVDRAFRDMALELARSEAALQDQANLLRCIVDSMGEGVVVADEKGKFLLFNPAAEQILRVGQTEAPPEEWTRRYGVYLPDMVTPYPAADLPLARAMRGEVVDQVEFFVRHAELPEGIWVSATGRPLRGEDGLLRGGVVVIRDITEQKQAEGAIRKLNEELERRVAERTAELAASNAELVQKNQENELFVYSVSHDLRSPLVNLEGFSRELAAVSKDLRSLWIDNELPPTTRDRGLALLDSDMAESIRFIQAGVLRLSSIIDALLRLSRAGRVEYHWQPVEVAPIVARVVEAMGATIAERKATVRVAHLPPVWGDPTAVEQIFANLIGNAVNYLDPKRPGMIEVGCKSTPDGSETNGERTCLTYYVKDNGLGIPEAYRPKLFQAFKRLHPEAAQGEGIGLAMVQRIVKRHNGKIVLEPTEGEGCTFSITLPAVPLNHPSEASERNGASTIEKEQEIW